MDDMPYMALVSTVGHRFHRHRQRQRDDGLHHRPQVAASTRSASTARRTAARSAIPRSRRSPSSPSAARDGRRRRDRHRDRGCDARRHGGAHAPAHRLRRHRAHVLLACSRTSSWAAARRTFFPRAIRAASARTRRTTSTSSRRRATRSPTRRRELAAAAAKPETRKLLGLFNDGNIDGALDRKFLKKGTVGKFPDQPDLTEEMRAALQVLSRNDNGFVLMVEAGRIDKYSHSLDWERAVYDTIMLDNAVQARQGFRGQAQRHADHRRARPRASGLDHRHLRRRGGRARCASGCRRMRRRSFPTIRRADAEGYPPSVDVSRRLALVFAAYPDYCDAGQALPRRARTADARQEGEKHASPTRPTAQPGAARKIGNLPFTARATACIRPTTSC